MLVWLHGATTPVLPRKSLLVPLAFHPYAATIGGFESSLPERGRYIVRVKHENGDDKVQIM